MTCILHTARINNVHVIMPIVINESDGEFSATVFIRLNAAAFINFFVIQVRRLFEGGVYTRVAFI